MLMLASTARNLINHNKQFHEAMASWLRGRLHLQPITVHDTDISVHDAEVLRNLIG